ncbi:MAG: TetR/AcrR family transcriptional regulator [Actinomycetota bacterium]|nr:TetR/AcrR family transcriptional regulator [Actinomycetota bacterium]
MLARPARPGGRPGGKEQLVEEAVGWISGHVERLLALAAEGGTVAALEAFIANWQQFLEANDYQASCPVLSVATEETTNGAGPAGPATTAFRSWQSLIAGTLRRDGVDSVRAERLSWLIVASLEGAVVLARSQRSPAPLDAVAEEMRLLISTAVG